MRIIVAMTPSGGIGKEGGIPWDLPSERRFFSKETKGAVVIMGRKTWESLVRAGVAPLRGRVNIVISSMPGKTADDCCWVTNLNEALMHGAATNREVYVIGGSELYREALQHPACDECIVTHVLRDIVGCDTFFPVSTAHAHGWGDLRMRVCKKEQLQVENGIPFFFARYRKLAQCGSAVLID